MDEFSAGTPDRKAYGMLVLVNLISATSLIISREIASAMPPLELAVIRGVLAIIGLFPLAYAEIKRISNPNIIGWISLGLMGFLGITLTSVTFLWGIQYSSAINAAIILATYPVVTNVLLALIWRTLPPRHHIIGVILSFIGILIVVAQGSWLKLRSLTFSVSDSVLILNVVVFALYNIFGQRVMKKYSPLVTSFYALIFGTILMLPWGIQQGLTQSWHMEWRSWLAVIYVGIFAIGIATYLNLMAIQRIGSGQVAILGNLQPVFGVILAVMILGERLAVYHWIGFGLVLAGVFLSIGSKKTFQLE